MTSARALGILGATARSARRVHLDGTLNVLIDTIDGLLLRARRPPLAVKVDGVEFRGYLRHRGFLEYLARGMAEESYYRGLILAAVDSGTTFIDAGAHIGVYTLLACRRARRVLAFEPDPYNLAALRRNVSRGGCANVVIHPEAVADRSGRARFRAFRSTFSGSLVAREVDQYREFEVDVVCLDDVLEDSDLGTLVVKLDVEGAEPLAIAGMAKTIARAPSLVLFVEVNPEALEAGGRSARQLVEHLLATGMDCSAIDEEQHALVPVRETDLLRKGNLLCRGGV